MVMNSPPAAPHVHHYSYPLDHGMLINIYKIQFVFRERSGCENEGGMIFDLMEQVDRSKEAGVAKECRPN